MGRTSRTLRRGVEEELVNNGSTGAGSVTIPNYGNSHLTATTVAEVYVLDSPAEGVKKNIMITGVTTATTSVVVATVRGSTGTAVKFGNATATQFTVTATSAAGNLISGVDLVGINSTLWGVVGYSTGIVFGNT